ncbi:hypothetical protein SteCoe_38474 [Stentor coeruleus]|uniref:Uncharacterized protein n=1 Tax=Stentor coeruleus TaxID=5963 RepID=A0A1R2ALG2_9CILI|nr:hypothetical protein SteCoe_38474 [Stentor coeruleus]
MSIEQNLLESLIKKLKEEFQGMIRYEILRGLDKPESNNYLMVPSEIINLDKFLESTLYNAIYPNEQIKVQEFLKKPSTLLTKFKFLRETGNFYTPNDAFLTQEFLNELIERKKSLLLVKNLNFDTYFFNELRPLASKFVNRPSLKIYLPSNFNEKFYDADYVTTVFITVDIENAVKIIEIYKVYGNIMEFKMPLAKVEKEFEAPIVPSSEMLWDSATSVIMMMRNIQQIEKQLNCEIEERKNNCIGGGRGYYDA